METQKPRFKIDDIDYQILDTLIDNSHTPLTDIAKMLNVSAGMVYLRVQKMERLGLIKGASILVDYDILGYSYISYVGVFLEKSHQTKFVAERLLKIPYVAQASIVSGKYNLFCKIYARNAKHTRDIIFQIDEIQGVIRTETFIVLEDVINDDNRLKHQIFNEMNL